MSYECKMNGILLTIQNSFYIIRARIWRCKSLKKVLMIIGGIVVGILILAILIFVIVSATSEKLVCESNEGNITIMYTKDNITGYKATGGLTYDLDAQQKVAEQIGVEEYINQFKTWFSTNTTGTCK